ncbi:uncharacterized protein LOC107615435 [Arachis ipaensis]|uniref:uncharacterized protein LOC107615435 n=1 Tax=Arachis ipaensis TaxID=130454 RepID=UPI0007AFCF50|nr:uncharacterized protein LOC107615435 [Arachis ipaensis]
MVHMTTLRIVLALAAAKQWHIKQLDINTTFLHGDLNEEGVTIIMVYVDDLVLTGDDLDEIDRIKRLLDLRFKIKDLGDLKYFLGKEVARSSKGIHICQRKYALDILKDFGYLDYKPVSTPMDYTCASKLSRNSGTALPDRTPYRQLIGRLLYLTNTRPDIAYAMGRLSQFIDCPTDEHMRAAFHMLKYLKGCPSVGVFFFLADNDLKLTGFADADWATCADTRKSITGHCFYLGSSLISWKSKK